MSHTVNFQGFVGVGIKQFTPKEKSYLCDSKNRTTAFTNSDLQYLDLNTKPNYTDSIAARVILSGCYSIDKNTGSYSSNGLEVLESTTTSFTQCTSTHLTQFAGGFITLPSKKLI
jgi:hypothetical protein